MEICTIKLLVIVLTCLALKSNAEKVQAQRKIASILGEDDHDDKVSPKIMGICLQSQKACT